jgi:ATP-binding protein involved in chromosome partitioning
MRIKTKVVPNIKNIIAVSSCKGGVGKSTTAANIALALKHLGHKVGVLDADIYGPSQTVLFNIPKELEIVDYYNVAPKQAYDVSVMSINMLVKDMDAMVWRGPMAAQTVEQLLYNTAWPELDYLIIDMPPGTGDIPLTLTQVVKLTGAVIVTTPQEIALADVRRGIEMFDKTNVNIFGIVENMAMHTCSECGHIEHIFGENGGAAISKQFEVPLLGSLPLNKMIRSSSDAGMPIVAFDVESDASKTYIKIAEQIHNNVLQLQKTEEETEEQQNVVE